MSPSESVQWVCGCILWSFPGPHIPHGWIYLATARVLSCFPILWGGHPVMEKGQPPCEAALIPRHRVTQKDASFQVVAQMLRPASKTQRIREWSPLHIPVRFAGATSRARLGASLPVSRAFW